MPTSACSAQAQSYIAERQQELAAIEAQHAAELQQERAAHENTKRLLRDRIIDGAIEGALKASGANARTREGAKALLRKEWQFSVSDRDGENVVTVSNGDAEYTISQAVENWLAGDAGAAFSTRRPQTADALARIQQVTRTR